MAGVVSSEMPLPEDRMASPGFEEDKQSAYRAPNDLVGSFRRLGERGPAYRIDEILNDRLVRITVLESGEKVEYRMSRLLQDPAA